MPLPTFFNLPPEKRQKILDCAIDEFAQHEYSSASISKIATRAGIAKGSLYQYFTDKSDLYHYLLELITQKKAELMAEFAPPEPGLTIFETLRRLFEGMGTFQLLYPDLARIGFRSLYGKSPLPEDIVSQASQSTQQYFCGLIEAGKQRGEIRPEIDSDTAAFMLMTTLAQLPQYLNARAGIEPAQIAAQGNYPIDDSRLSDVYHQIILILQYGIEARQP